MMNKIEDSASNNSFGKCKCCPYGHHVGLDFVEFAKESVERKEIQKIKRFQQKLERRMNESSDQNDSSPNHCIVYDSDQSMSSKCSPNSAVVNQQNNFNYFPMDDKNSGKSHNDSSKKFPVLSDANQKINSKSFVVSYEHLTSIREQMSTSLKRVQELENEVKHMHSLKQKVDVLTHKNEDLENKLKMLENQSYNNNIDSYLDINWKSYSDIPIHVINTIESLCQVNLSKTNLPKIMDTSSSYHLPVTDRQNQAEIAPPRIKRRNFGVTVKPNHHHFTQQITTTPIYRGVSVEEHLSNGHKWVTSLDSDTNTNFGYLICNIFESCLNNNFHQSLQLLSNELELIIEYLKKPITDNSCQTVRLTTFDFGNQVNIKQQKNICNKYSQVSPFIGDDKSTETEIPNRENKCVSIIPDPVSQFSVGVNSDKKTFHDKATLKEQFMRDVGLNARKVRTSDTSSSTDQHLMDNLIATHIEDSMNMIHDELKQEIIHSHTEHTLLKQMTESYSSFLVDTSTAQTQTFSTLVDYSTNYIQSLKESCSLFDHKNQSLGRSDISQLSILDSNMDSHNDQMMNDDNDDDNGPSLELKFDQNSKEIYEYCTKNDLSVSNDDVLQVNCNIIKQDGDTNFNSDLPPEIKKSCELFTKWMNDSTTICSKDLNESLSTIRKFWFEITEKNSINIEHYLNQFYSFNPIMKEKIINMTDNTGNTCLHYAVSEGRWSIVKQILDTKLACVNKTNKAGYSVLMLAPISEDFDESTIRQLISESEIDQASANELRQTVLMIGSGRGRLQLVQWLLEAGASVNLVDSTGSTALMCACDNGHLEVVKVLLSRNDINTELEDNTGSNAMKIAMDNSYKDVGLLIFAKNNLQKTTNRSKRRSGSNSHPTSPLSPRKLINK